VSGINCGEPGWGDPATDLEHPSLVLLQVLASHGRH
jgi:hypothetical protein